MTTTAFRARHASAAPPGASRHRLRVMRAQVAPPTRTRTLRHRATVARAVPSRHPTRPRAPHARLAPRIPTATRPHPALRASLATTPQQKLPCACIVRQATSTTTPIRQPRATPPTCTCVRPAAMQRRALQSASIALLAMPTRTPTLPRPAASVRLDTSKRLPVKPAAIHAVKEPPTRTQTRLQRAKSANQGPTHLKRASCATPVRPARQTRTAIQRQLASCVHLVGIATWQQPRATPARLVATTTIMTPAPRV